MIFVFIFIFLEMSGAESMSKSLRQVASGEKARIVSVAAEGEIGRRLRDMGLSPGTEIEILGRAPLKDPVSIRLKNYTLTLRNSEADYISVEPLEV
jgi:ferrous iron transport protein A